MRKSLSPAEQEEIKLFPLPRKDLYDRYIHLFNALNRNQYATLVGMPQSGRSGFLLASMMQCNQLFKNDFDFDKNIFISINAVYKTTTANEYISILIPAITPFLGKKERERSIQLLASNKNEAALNFAYTSLKEKAQKEGKKYVFAIWGLDELLQYSPESLQVLSNLFASYSPEERQAIGLIFVLSPLTFYKISGFTFGRLLNENIIYFKALTEEEMDYTRVRMELLRGYTITDEMHAQFKDLSQGFYGVYFRLFQQNKEVNLNNEVDSILTDPQFEPFIASAISLINPGDPQQAKIGLELRVLDKNGKFISPILKAAQEKGVTPNRDNLNLALTPQQKEILTYLIANKDTVISREDIAKHIWGKVWSVKYSDWAIDKQITAIRKAIESSKFRLTVVRGKGVRLSGIE